MSSDFKVIPYPTEPKDMSVWFEHRDQFRRLFLEENKTLREVKAIMESHHAFPKSKYETVPVYSRLWLDRPNMTWKI
jgi:hypothetical protein